MIKQNNDQCMSIRDGCLYRACADECCQNKDQRRDLRRDIRVDLAHLHCDNTYISADALFTARDLRRSLAGCKHPRDQLFS